MVFRLLVLSISILFSACSPTNTGSLLTNNTTASSCPENSCAQGTADPSETKVILTTPITAALPVGNSLAEVAGECYPSLYPQNQFVVSIIAPNGASIPSASVLPTSFVARCVEGRFYVPVSLSGRAAGTYTISLTFEVITDAGQVIRPPFKTVAATYLYRP